MMKRRQRIGSSTGISQDIGIGTNTGTTPGASSGSSRVRSTVTGTGSGIRAGTQMALRNGGHAALGRAGLRPAGASPSPGRARGLGLAATLALGLALAPPVLAQPEESGASSSDRGGMMERMSEGMSEGMHRAREALGNTRVPTDPPAKIASAMAAAPAAISDKATVLDFPSAPGRAPVVLRQGRNGWTCFPDNPATPGRDPMCHDREWMKWMQAFLAREKPVITGVGISYMLQGGSDASNTDPFAQKPPDGGGWMEVGPHIMVVSPTPWDRNMFPAEMGQGGAPWIMFPGTPYEHLMVPVR